jgi:hypothetical protein
MIDCKCNFARTGTGGNLESVPPGRCNDFQGSLERYYTGNRFLAQAQELTFKVSLKGTILEIDSSRSSQLQNIKQPNILQLQYPQQPGSISSNILQILQPGSQI